MVLYPLTSKQVLEFMPLDAWTEVHLQPSNVKNVYFVTTKDKMEKRKKDIQSISLESSLFNKIPEFKVFEIVAVEIEDRWFRGKLISFNEFLTDNTIILLIDFGYVYRTNLENLFVLPYYFMYEPLVLPVTFKDFIPKESTFSIKPLLSESNLHEGSVLVDVNCNETKLEKQLLESKKDINSANDSKIISVKNNITNGHDSDESSLYPSRKPFAIEFNENSKNCLENVKLKDIENGSYINSKYLMKCTSTQIDESIKKSRNITENEIVSINTPELEVISNIELRNGDTVFCTHFEDFNHLYLCKCSKNNTTPDNHSLIINSKMTNDIILKKNPKYKDIVSVKFEEKIFRAEVLDKCGEKYSVFLIDIGKNIDVLGDNIYELPNYLKNIPGLALKVSLNGTTGLKITTAVKSYFYNLWQNDPVPLTLRFNEFNFNYINEISLIKQSNGQDIVDDLVKMSNGSNRLSTNWQSGDHVEFLYGNNVDNIFVRKIKLYEEFKNVLDQLKRKNIDHYKPIAAKIGGYAAVYSENFKRRIYRARIMKQDSDDSSNFKCNLIDIGKFDVIPSKYVFSLPNYVSLNKVPTMVRIVSLIGLPKISNSKIIPYLYSLKGKTYVMEYDSKPGKSNIQEVVLKELRSGVSLNDEIQKIYKK